MPMQKPGTKIRSPQAGRPLMVVLNLLGRRWSLRILWELHMNGPSSFRVLQRHCGGISPTVLNTRLSELREAGVIALRGGEGYVITDEGLELGRIIQELNMWAKSWAKRTVPGRASVSEKALKTKSGDTFTTA